MTNKQRILAKLRKKYDQERELRGEAIDYVQKIRMELAKKTFADLDSRGKNPYFQNLRKREQRFKKRYLAKDRRLEKLDRKINEMLMRG